MQKHQGNVTKHGCTTREDNQEREDVDEKRRRERTRRRTRRTDSRAPQTDSQTLAGGRRRSRRWKGARGIAPRVLDSAARRETDETLQAAATAGAADAGCSVKVNRARAGGGGWAQLRLESQRRAAQRRQQSRRISRGRRDAPGSERADTDSQESKRARQTTAAATREWTVGIGVLEPEGRRGWSRRAATNSGIAPRGCRRARCRRICRQAGTRCAGGEPQGKQLGMSRPRSWLAPTVSSARGARTLQPAGTNSGTARRQQEAAQR